MSSPHNSIGNIILKVKEGVQTLQNQIDACACCGKCQSGLHELKNTLRNAEEDLQLNAQQIVKELNSAVKVIDVAESKRLEELADKDLRTWCIRSPEPQVKLLPKRWHRTIRYPHTLEHGDFFKDEDFFYKPREEPLPPILKKKYSPKLEKKKKIKYQIAQSVIHIPQNAMITPFTKGIKSSGSTQSNLLSMFERNVMPSSTQLQLEPPPVSSQTIKWMDMTSTQKKKVSTTVFDFKDIPPSKGFPSKQDEKLDEKPLGLLPLPEIIVAPCADADFESPPPVPHSLIEGSSYKIAIEDGYVRTDTVEYVMFRKDEAEYWGQMSILLRFLENFLIDYSVPFVYADRYRIKKYADLYGTDRKPSKENLLSFLVNPKIVEEIMKIPGQRYKCPHGKVNAAITIQSQWRGYKLRADYKNTVEKKWACGIIAFSWTLRAKMKEIRIKLSQTRADNLEIHTHKFKAFKLSWHRIQNSKRVIVHLPSLGYPEYVRSNMKFLHTQENIQISRICEIADPNVDVIYLSPDHVTEEAKAYYDKLLALRSAVISGNVEKIKNVENRVTYIVPEIISSYPCMNMCLATLMKYSPKAVERVKKLVKGREAYIVPGAVYLDDLDVARQLNLPILGPDPQTAHLYSTKSGVKQIFLKSRVNTPPGASNIYNEEQLKECLAKLIIENLSIRKWVFKFDVSVSSNGIAYCNVMDLKCYNWILNESLRMGKSWSLKWAHAASTNLLLNELPQFLKHCVSPVNKSSYCVWDIYKQYFFARGGIVEAYPPTEVFTAIEVDLLVVPSGKNEILCSGDQILSSQPFDPWGLSVPQCSIEPPDLNEACYRIAKECKSKGIYGYVSVCFLTFFKDPKSKQILWAIDMRIGYSNSLAMFQLMKYISNCYFDAEKHEIIIDRPSKDSSKAGTDNSRYGVFSTKLYHSNLSIIHYSVFFHMCRAFGIGYDIKEKQGTVFTVFDYLARNFIGMLVVSNDLRNALITFARNLNTLHAEVSGSRTKQSTNFMEAVASIQEIIRITGVVEQDETMKENNSKTKT